MSVRDDARVPPVESAAATRIAPAADPPRPRTGAGVWSLPPWRRAPVLPFGQPAVLLAVVAAAAILACAAASAPLFLSSASSAALQRLPGEQCASASTAALKVETTADQLAALDRKAVPAVTGTGLAAPHLTASANDRFAVAAGSQVISQPLSKVIYRAGSQARTRAVRGGGARTPNGPHPWWDAGRRGGPD